MAIFCLFNGVCTTHPLIYDYNLLGSICDQEFTWGIFDLPFCHFKIMRNVQMSWHNLV